MNFLGLFLEGPNTGAALIKQGKLVAIAEEERFNRVKTAANYFPVNAIKYCLKQGKLKLNDIKSVGIGWDHTKYPKYIDKYMSKI
ncbi:MAG: carbamoyltransferase N-terminal domain-containing protein, partial [Rhodothermaceae bacterium]